jgi:hypothetical protein
VYATPSRGRADAGDERGHGAEVGVEHVVAEGGPAVAARQVPHRADGVDACADPGVGRRHDLGAVAEIDLVAVVLRGVVAGRHHDAAAQPRCRIA